MFIIAMLIAIFNPSRCFRSKIVLPQILMLKLHAQLRTLKIFNISKAINIDYVKHGFLTTGRYGAVILTLYRLYESSNRSFYKLTPQTNTDIYTHLMVDNI